jgi:hypothetical protein
VPDRNSLSDPLLDIQVFCCGVHVSKALRKQKVDLLCKFSIKGLRITLLLLLCS